MSYNLHSRQISFKITILSKTPNLFHNITSSPLSCVVTHSSYLTHAIVIKQCTVHEKLVVATKGKLPQTNDQA